MRVEFNKVVKKYGAKKALDIPAWSLEDGEVVGLVGSNGAGKTTFFNLITGFDDANEGKWSFNGRQVAGMAPYRLARIGMVRTFQLTKALAKMSVLDNMRKREPFWRKV